MAGFVSVDILCLTSVQWLALLGSMGMYLFAYHRSVSFTPVIVLSQGLLFVVFYKTQLLTDTRLLFQSCQYLAQFSWAQFLSEFAHRDFVKLHPPFYTFFVSRFQVYPWHQCLGAVWAVLCGLLMRAVYGRHASLLLATPLYAMMSTQPGPDFLLFGLLLIVVRLLQLQNRVGASVIYGLAFSVKALMLLTMPFLLWKLRGWMLVSLGLVGLYLAWSQQYYFGVQQWHYVSYWFLLKCFVR